MIFFLWLLMAAEGIAAPKKFQVWLLSSEQVADVFRVIQGSLPEFAKTAEYDPNTYQNCRPMGDMCFHPQHGLIPYPNNVKKDTTPTPSPVVKRQINKGLGHQFLTNPETKKIDCEKKQYFDIFCGQATGPTQVSKQLEIWIDVSSSMRTIDPNDPYGKCERQRFVEKVQKACAKSPLFQVFNTGKKQLGGMDTLCLNHGLNDLKRLKEWIKRSSAEMLIVITDIFEYTSELTHFAELNNGELKGIKGDFLAKKMGAEIAKLQKFCAK